MANLIKFRRSAVPGKRPAVSDITPGELAINTFDGKVYTNKDTGSRSIVEVSNINRWGDTCVGRVSIGAPGDFDFGIADPPASEYQLSAVARRDGANAKGMWPISIAGSASTATTAAALATGRTFSLTGDVTGTSAAWTGSTNISIATTLIAEFSAVAMLRERAAMTSNAAFSVGAPGQVPFGVGPVLPPGMAVGGIGPDAYNPVHLASGSFC